MTNTMLPKTTAKPDPAARADRRERYLAYGFTEAEAEMLADAMDGLWPLHHLKVKHALDAGATHAQAFAVFA